MENLSQWYSSLDSTMQVFWVCAIISSIVFLIQFVLTFIGVDAADDIEFDTGAGDTLDAGGMISLFSVRNAVNFLLGFGWGGVCLAGYIQSTALLVAGAFIIGCMFVAVCLWTMKQMMRLESSGTINIKDCEGKECDVYLRIPASRDGKGKVQISINGSVFEFDAVTDDNEKISTGKRVRVLEALGGSVLLVTAINDK